MSVLVLLDVLEEQGARPPPDALLGDGTNLLIPVHLGVDPAQFPGVFQEL